MSLRIPPGKDWAFVVAMRSRVQLNSLSISIIWHYCFTARFCLVYTFISGGKLSQCQFEIFLCNLVILDQAVLNIHMPELAVFEASMGTINNGQIKEGKKSRLPVKVLSFERQYCDSGLIPRCGHVRKQVSRLLSSPQSKRQLADRLTGLVQFLGRKAEQNANIIQKDIQP